MAITKQVNYQVNFNPNTTKVKSALQNLQQTLNAIQTKPIGLDDGSIRSAVASAKELQIALQNATNVDTGRLDIGKFSQQLKNSGRDLKSYANDLRLLGTDGRKAFMQLTQSIAHAEAPLRKSNKLLTEFATTLKNTVRWQISASLIQGFTSAVSKAIGYVKELDKSLNDIRIVSGKSAEYMNNFAEKANQAAKKLSASTLEYTEAAKIFYQQGLGGKEVEERTEAVVKMAKVTGESADKISSYMTAIWNNFDNGTKSLEYYADAMTALGAATAASTDEIATGLEKFAAIGDTVGLSYEYATSMVATLVDKTRQSSETIGTALKTILSRMQGLSLGETLEDGTDLNKYSKALATVGIMIKDSNGQLKDMDVIIDELGGKWKTLGRDQQMALAQTIGGVRQYTQLISIMDNYDSFKINVDIASNSTDTLNKQLKIYEDSLEAAQQRAQTSFQDLYQEIIPADTIKEFYDLVSTMVDSLTGFIEGMGGIGNVLMPIIGMIASRYMPQLTEGAFRFANYMRETFTWSSQNKQTFTQQAQEMLRTSGILSSDSANYRKQLRLTEEILKIQREEELLGNRLTESQRTRNEEKKKELQLQIDILEAESQAEKARSSKMKTIVEEASENTIRDKSKPVEESRTAQIEATNKKYEGNLAAAAELGDDEGFKEYQGKRDAEIAGINAKHDLKVEEIENQETSPEAVEQRRQAATGLKDSYVASSLLERSGINNLQLNGEGEQPQYEQKVSEVEPQKMFEDVSARMEKSNQAMGVAFSEEELEGMETLNELQDDFNKKKQKAEKMLKAQSKIETAIAKSKKKEQKLLANEEKSRKKIDKYNNLAKKGGKQRAKYEKLIAEENENIEKNSAAINRQKKVTQTLEGATSAATKDVAVAAKAVGTEQQKILNSKIATGKQEVLNNGFTEQSIEGIKEVADEEQAAFDTRIKAEKEAARRAEEDKIAMEAKQQRQKDFGLAIQGVTSAMSGLSMAWSGLQSLGSIWSNDDLSTTEKMMSSLMALTSIITGVTQVSQGMAAVSKFITKIKQEETVAVNLETDAEVLNTAMKNKGIIASTKSMLASIKKTAQDKIEAGSSIMKGWAEAFAQAAALNPVPLAIMAVGAAAIGAMVIGGAASAMGVGGESTSSKKKKVEKANTMVNETGENLDAAKERQDNLNDTLEKYRAIREEMNGLTEGSKEWNEKLRESNKLLLDTLQNSPELAKYITKDENGNFEITEENQKKAEEEAAQDVLTATAANYAAKQEQRRATIDLQKDTIVKDAGVMSDELFGNWWNFGSATGWANATENQLYDAEISRILDKWDSYSAEELAEFEKLYPGIMDLKQSMDENTLATKMENQIMGESIIAADDTLANSEYAATLGEITSKAYGIEYKKAMKKLEDDGWGTDGIAQWDSVNNEVKTVFNEYAKAAGLEGATVIDTGGDDNNRTFIYTDASGEEHTVSLETMMTTVASSNATQATEKNAKKLIEKLDNVDSKVDIAATSRIMNSEGVKRHNKKQDFYSNFGGAVLTQVDYELGTGYAEEWQKRQEEEKLTAEEVDTFNEDERELIGNAAKKMVQGQEPTVAEARAWKDFVVSDQVAQLAESWGVTKTEAALDLLLGDGKDGALSSETLSALGVKSTSELADNVRDLQDKKIEEGKTYHEQFKEAGSVFTKVSGSAQESLEKAADQISAFSGDANRGDKLLDDVNNMLSNSGLGEQDQIKALEQISQIDWSKKGAGNQIKTIIEDLGGEIDMTDEEWNAFVESLNQDFKATASIEDLQKNIKLLAETTKDLEFGGLISKEEYDLLVQYNKELEKLFQLTLDGKYRFLGNGDEIREQIKNSIRDDLGEVSRKYGAIKGKTAADYVMTFGKDDSGKKASKKVDYAEWDTTEEVTNKMKDWDTQTKTDFAERLFGQDDWLWSDKNTDATEEEKEAFKKNSEARAIALEAGGLSLADYKLAIQSGNEEAINEYTVKAVKILQEAGVGATEEDFENTARSLLSSAEDYNEFLEYKNLLGEDFIDIIKEEEKKQLSYWAKSGTALGSMNVQYTKNYKEIEKLEKKTGALTEEEKERLKLLKLENEELETQIWQLQQEEKYSNILNNIRDSEGLEEAKNVIKNNPNSDSRQTNLAYNEVASELNAGFGVEIFDAEIVKERWSEILPLLEAEEVKWSQIQRVLFEAYKPETVDDFKGQIGELDAELQGTMATTTDTEQANKELFDTINNFNPVTDGLDTLATSLETSMGAAASLEYMCKNLKNAVPEELQTIYTIWHVDKKGTYDSLTEEGKAAYNQWIMDEGKNYGWAAALPQNFQEFVGSSSFKNSYIKGYTEALNQDTDFTITIKNDTDGSKNSSGSFQTIDLTKYSETLAGINEQIEDQEKALDKMSKAWEQATYNKSEYLKLQNIKEVDDKLEGLVNSSNFKDFSYENYLSGLYVNEKTGKYNDTDLGRYRQANNDLRYSLGIKKTTIDTDLIPEAIKQILALTPTDSNGNIVDIGDIGLTEENIKTAGGQQIIKSNIQNIVNGLIKQSNDLLTEVDEEGKRTVSEGNKATYDGIQDKIKAYQDFISTLDGGFSDLQSLIDDSEATQEQIDDLLEEDKETISTAIQNAYTEAQKWNEIARTTNESKKALFSEQDFSDAAMKNREEARKQDLAILKDDQKDIEDFIKHWESIPEELRSADWEEVYLEKLSESETKSAEILQAERDNTEAALTDIISKYESFNSKLDNLITEYENILSKTENYAYFDKEGKLLDTYATRMTTTLKSATAAQEKYINAQKAYIDVVKKAQQDGVITNEEQLKIDEAKNTMIEEEGTLLEAIKAVYEEITNSLEKYNDELERNKEKLEAITEITDTYVSILEELGERFNLGEVAQPTALLALQKASVDMAIKNVKVIKEQRDAQKQIVDLIDEELKNYEQGTVQYNELLGIRNEEASKLIELETELASTMSDGITAAAELYSSRIEKIIINMQDAMAGANYSNMDDLQTAFDKAEEINKLYLDSNKQEYELSKLRRNLNKDLSGNENIYAQQKLKNILEDIEKIEKDKIKLSEYDLKMLNSKYSLYKAQIALEEAQNNKTQVRLMRNSQGNWNYVFTADQNKIDQAAQQVEDAQYNIYSQSNEYLKQTQGNIITLQKEWTEAIQAIYEDTSLSLEERQKKINETNEYYATKLAHYGSETTKILDVLDIKFEDTTLSLISGYSSVEEIQKATIDALTSGFKETEGAVVEFETSVNTAFDNAGIDMQTFADKAVEMADPNNPKGLVGSFDSITKSITTMCSNAITMLSGLLEKLKEVPGFEKVTTNAELDLIEADAQFLGYENPTGNISYKANKDGTFDVTFTGNSMYEGLGTATVTVGADTTSAELHELLKKALGISAFPGEKEQITTKNKDDNKDNKDNKDNDKAGPQYNKKVQNPVQYNKDEDYAAIIIKGFEEYENSSKTMNAKQKAMSKIFQANNRRNSKIDNEGLMARRYTNEELRQLLDEGKMPQFNTGGYTGDWGSSEGRLAILHEKELILNKEDTAKILSAVEIARTIAGNANLQMFGLANALSGVAKLVYQQEPQTIQQDVHIEATFPGVQSAFEIETALKNIVNDISQYAEIPKE